jgi:hypothetical protein
MIISANSVQKIVTGKARSYLLIENLTNSDVYLSSEEFPAGEDYLRNCVLLKQNGILELSPAVYQGPFYAYSSIESDIRVLEL